MVRFPLSVRDSLVIGQSFIRYAAMKGEDELTLLVQYFPRRWLRGQREPELLSQPHLSPFDYYFIEVASQINYILALSLSRCFLLVRRLPLQFLTYLLEGTKSMHSKIEKLNESNLKRY